MQYETVIGLEVHTELLTKTKIFCSCTTQFGGEPNTHVCEVCMGLPGTLPKLNKKVVELAVRLGLATNCEITRYNKFDRKNYFYPDLPKAYQVSQLYLPICQEGFVEISDKKIRIKEIHMEEDAGKLIHDRLDGETLVDYNRCGVPLLEIVSEPDMRNAQEVIEYLEKLKAILIYTGVSDGKMQEGSLRADINLSVRPKGEKELGTRTEMKNMNSFRAIERAIKAESERQIKVLESGERVIQQTRRWDDSKNESYSMRSKEEAKDYKYFPEPDIPPIKISDEYVEKVRESLPELPDEKSERYIRDFKLSKQDTEILTQSPYISSLFEEVTKSIDDPKEASKWVLGEVLRLLRKAQLLPENMPFSASSLCVIIKLLKQGKINRGTAKDVFEKVFYENIDPEKYIKENSLMIETDYSLIKETVENVIAQNEKSVTQYRNGKTQAMQYLIGQSMKALRGKAPANEVKKILSELL